MILKTRDVKELLVNIQVRRAYTIAGRLTVTVVRQVYSSYGAIPVKYKIEGVIGELCEIDMPIYRYADVLTLLSEAIVRNGNSITQEAGVIESSTCYSWWTESLSIE